MMTTIEQKANLHAERIFPQIAEKYQTAPWNEFREALAQIYLAGVSEGLASQWRSVKDEMPEIDKEVVVVYSHPLTPNFIEKAIAYFDGEDWYTIDGEHIRPTHWMSIPELPKDESE